MSKKSYNSMSVASRNADNFIRTYNKQLEKAYRTLGAESTIYKNLIGNTRNMETRTNKEGIVQLSRSKANIDKYNANNAVRELKNRYYADTQKKVINPRYNVQNEINTKIKALKASNINPTASQIKALSSIDEKISAIFENYSDSRGSVKELYSDKIKDLSDITKTYKTNPEKAYNDMRDYLTEHPELSDTIKSINNLSAVELRQIENAPVSASELLEMRRNTWGNKMI